MSDTIPYGSTPVQSPSAHPPRVPLITALKESTTHCSRQTNVLSDISSVHWAFDVLRIRHKCIDSRLSLLSHHLFLSVTTSFSCSFLLLFVCFLVWNLQRVIPFLFICSNFYTPFAHPFPIFTILILPDLMVPSSTALFLFSTSKTRPLLF